MFGYEVEDHLVRNGSNAVESRFSPVPLDITLFGVPHSAEGLNRAIARPEAGFAGPVFGHIGQGSRVLPRVICPGRLLPEQFSGFEF